MKVRLISQYTGKAITRQYKRAKALTYLNSGLGGTLLGTSSLLSSTEHTAKAFFVGAAGVMFLSDAVSAFKTLLKLAKPYDAICKRALKIYKKK